MTATPDSYVLNAGKETIDFLKALDIIGKEVSTYFDSPMARNGFFSSFTKLPAKVSIARLITISIGKVDIHKKPPYLHKFVCALCPTSADRIFPLQHIYYTILCKIIQEHRINENLIIFPLHF